MHKEVKEVSRSKVIRFSEEEKERSLDMTVGDG